MTDRQEYETLELLARMSGYKGIEYETELKDGRPHKIKNIRIQEIDLTKNYLTK